jgi:hypothetical protein
VLDAGWGLEAVEGEKKGEERIYPRSHLGSPSFFVSKCKRTSARGWVLKRGQRERGRGGRPGVPSRLVCKEGEEKRRKEEEKEWLAEFHLNFEKFKNWSK